MILGKKVTERKIRVWVSLKLCPKHQAEKNSTTYVYRKASWNVLSLFKETLIFLTDFQKKKLKCQIS